MGLTGYIIAGGLAASILSGGAGYFGGRHAQRNADDLQIVKQREQLNANSRDDERMLASTNGSLQTALIAALGRGDRAAAPIILDMNRGLQNSPLATSADCRVPADVVRNSQSLHGAAERAAAAADAAGAAVTGGTQQ